MVFLLEFLHDPIVSLVFYFKLLRLSNKTFIKLTYLGLYVLIKNNF